MSKKLMMNNYSGVEYPVYLVKGETLGSIINQLKQRASTTITSVVFTKEKIPSEKILEGIDVSESTSEYKAYGYVQGSTIYISPEIKNGVLYANEFSSYMFNGQSTLKEVVFDNFNTENTASFAVMFSGCTSLLTLDLSSFDTSNVTNMNSMFINCTKITEINLSSFDNAKNLQRMNNTFGNCVNLKSLDLSHLSTDNIIDMYHGFSGCRKLNGTITISNPNISTYTNIFANTSTSSDAKFIVKYIDEETKKMAEKLVATKSSNSNVFLWEGDDI